MPTVPSEPLLLATTATLPLSESMSEAAPAPAAVMSAGCQVLLGVAAPLAADAGMP